MRAFPILSRDLVVGNIDIFHPEAHTFHQAQTSSIQQTGHEMRHAVEVGQHARDFLSGEHHRHVSRSFCALNLPQCWEILLEHSAREKDEGMQCHILRRSCDMVMHGQVCQKGSYLLRSQVLGVALVMPQDKVSHPEDLGLFRSDTHVFQAQHQAHLIE